MRGVSICFIMALCLSAKPSQAFLDKLDLLKSLKGNLGGGGYAYNAPSRPLYQSGGNYGYGFGRTSSSYGVGSVGNDEQVIKIIKVVVPALQSSYSNGGYGSGYGGGYSSSGSYASSWAPVQQASTVQVAAPQQQVPVQVAAPQQLVPVQPVPVFQPAPAPTPTIVQSTAQQAVSVQQPQTIIKTVRLVITEDDSNQVGGGYSNSGQGYANQAYGDQAFKNVGSGQGWTQGWNNGISNLWGKSWKSGGILEKIGC